MNIFMLDTNPKLAARYHNDRHCVKMILESAQLLSTAHFVLDGISSTTLRPTHINHPCALWVRSGPVAYNWTSELMYWLLREYTARYGKVHAYEELWPLLAHHPSGLPTRVTFLGDAPQCMPEEYKNHGNPVAAYRRYYFGAKQHIAQWKCGEPVWWTLMKEEALT